MLPKLYMNLLITNCGYCLKFHQQVLSVLNEKTKNTKISYNADAHILGENSVTLSKIAIAR